MHGSKVASFEKKHVGKNRSKKCILEFFFHFKFSFFQVPVASWFDDMNDRELLDLIPFLENLSKVESVYSVLQQSKDQNNKSAGILPLPVTVTSSSASHPNNSNSSPISSVMPENNSASLKKNNGTSNNVTPNNTTATTT